MISLNQSSTRFWLRFASVLCVTLALLACAGGSSELGTSSSSGTPGPTGGASPSSAEMSFALEVLTLTNQQRMMNGGLPPLSMHSGMSSVAWNYSRRMELEGFFAHTDPQGAGPADRLTAAGITWSLVAENIARGQATPQAVVDAWMQSPGHRANILHASPTEIGIGCFIASNGRPTWTQLFRRP